MPTSIELLLWLSLGLSVITIIFSLFIIRRFQKVTKLTTFLYNQLIFTYNKEKPTSKLTALSVEEKILDPLLMPLEPENKLETRIENHFMKILETKCSVNDEDGPKN